MVLNLQNIFTSLNVNMGFFAIAFLLHVLFSKIARVPKSFDYYYCLSHNRPALRKLNGEFSSSVNISSFATVTCIICCCQCILRDRLSRPSVGRPLCTTFQSPP